MLGTSSSSKSFRRNDFSKLLIISFNSLSSSLFVCSSVFGGCSLAKGQMKTLGSFLEFEIIITNASVQIRVGH